MKAGKRRRAIMLKATRITRIAQMILKTSLFFIGYKCNNYGKDSQLKASFGVFAVFDILAWQCFDKFKYAEKRSGPGVKGL